MPSKVVYLSGTAKWAKTKTPDPEFKIYTLDLFPDDESWEKFRASGMQMKVRQSKQEDEGEFIKLKREVSKEINGRLIDLGPPKTLLQVLDEDGNEAMMDFDGFIGNGSKVVCKVRVYDTRRGKGHELMAVAVTDLVEYEPMEGEGEYPF